MVNCQRKPSPNGVLTDVPASVLPASSTSMMPVVAALVERVNTRVAGADGVVGSTVNELSLGMPFLEKITEMESWAELCVFLTVALPVGADAKIDGMPSVLLSAELAWGTLAVAGSKAVSEV